jgi:hypothetical protein
MSISIPGQIFVRLPAPTPAIARPVSLRTTFRESENCVNIWQSCSAR